MKASTPRILYDMTPAELTAYIESRIPAGLVRENVYRIVFFDVVGDKWEQAKDKPKDWKAWIDAKYKPGTVAEKPLVVSALVKLGWSPIDALNRVSAGWAK